MFSIKEKTINEIEIKKSKFITVAKPISSLNEINIILKDIRKEFVNASHYCYAYILGDNSNIQKTSDDGEPTRTAGFPILEVLLKHNLTNLIVIVIRYFGGVKLGTGGLIRAYSTSTSKIIEKVVLTKKITTYECTITCDYEYLGSIEKFLRENTNLIKVNYDSLVSFIFKVDELDFDMVKEQLFKKNHYQNNLKIINKSSEYA